MKFSPAIVLLVLASPAMAQNTAPSPAPDIMIAGPLVDQLMIYLRGCAVETRLPPLGQPSCFVEGAPVLNLISTAITTANAKKEEEKKAAAAKPPSP